MKFDDPGVRVVEHRRSALEAQDLRSDAGDEVGLPQAGLVDRLDVDHPFTVGVDSQVAGWRLLVDAERIRPRHRADGALDEGELIQVLVERAQLEVGDAVVGDDHDRAREVVAGEADDVVADPAELGGAGRRRDVRRWRRHGHRCCRSRSCLRVPCVAGASGAAVATTTGAVGVGTVVAVSPGTPVAGVAALPPVAGIDV